MSEYKKKIKKENDQIKINDDNINDEEQSENVKEETADDIYERERDRLFAAMDARLESLGFPRKEETENKNKNKILDPSKEEHTKFVVRKVHGYAKTTENIGQYRYHDGIFRASYGIYYDRVIIEKTGDCYLFKFDNKYLKTSGHWIRSTDSRNDATRYELIKNTDIKDPHTLFDVPTPVDDLYYIKDISSGQLINMDSDGDFNVKNSGRYVLVFKFKI